VSRLVRWPAIVLGGWSILVWAGRLRNIAADGDLDPRTGLVPFTFVAGGAVVIAMALARSKALRQAVTILAAWTIGVWVVRGTAIVLADHDAGFTAVHTVLAVVSIGLALLALRSVGWFGPDRRRVPASGTGSRPRP
jgi:hypothetical protein